LLAALLRLAAMLVVGAASFLRMRLSRLPGECHADATPATLPPANSGNSKKAQPAAANSQTHKALMLMVSPLILAKAGTQGSPRSLFRREAAAQDQSKPPGLSWIPAPHPERAAGASKGAGTSGEELLATPRS